MTDKKLLAQVNLREVLFQNHDNLKSGTLVDSPTLWLNSILPTIFGISGIILLLYIIFGAFLIISGAGDTQQTDKGKKALTNAVLGFAIMFSSYWIIQLVEVLTGIPIMNSNWI